MTPHWLHSFAMRQRGAFTPDKWLSQALDCAYWFGADEDERYLCGVPASPNPIVGSRAGNILSPANTPHWQQAFNGLGDDPLGVGFDAGTLDSFDAANASIHDVSTGPLAILIPLKFTAPNPGSMLLLNKAQAGAGGYGYKIHFSIFAQTRLRLQVYGPGGTVSTATQSANPAVGVAHWLFAYISPVLGSIGLLSSWSPERTASLAGIGSLTNPEIFSLGSGGFSVAAPAVVATIPIWTANAEAVIAAARAGSIATWWAS